MHMFNKFQSQFSDVISSGFCPEVLALKKYYFILLSSIAGDSRKDLEIDIHAFEAFRNIKRTLKTCGNSVATQIIDQTKVTKSSIDIVLNIMRDNTSVKIITQSEFIGKKKPDRIVVTKDEIDAAAKSKRFQGKTGNEYVHMQYSCDTFSFESLYLTIRDIMFSPLTPNTLAV